MKQKYRLFVIFSVITLILSGCWGRTELNELAIVTAIGFDKAEEGYEVSVQVLNPGEIAGKNSTGRTEVVTFKTTGDTVFEALRKLSTSVPRSIFVSHLREVIFGEEFAKDGIGKALDFLSRDHEMRTDFYLTIAKDTSAYNILNVQTNLENIPANHLFYTLTLAEEKWAPGKVVRLDELIDSIVSKGKQPVLTGVYIKGDPKEGRKIQNTQQISPTTSLHIDNIGVLKNDKLVGWLNEDESKGFNYITDNVHSTIITLPCENGRVSIETSHTKTKLKGKIVDGKPKIDINLKTEGDIGEIQCKVDILNKEQIKVLEKKYEDDVREKIEAVIHKIKNDYQSDIFGFGEVIRRSEPSEWKGMMEDWNNELPNLDIAIHVDAHIRGLGTINESFQKDL